MTKPGGWRSKQHVQATAERLLEGGVFLLPLLCWPGLEHPFSTPKTWLLALLDLGVVVRYLQGSPWQGGIAPLAQRPCSAGADSSQAPSPERVKPAGASDFSGWPWLAWLAAVALSAAIASYASFQALLLTVLPLPLCWALTQGRLPAGRVMRALAWGSAAESAIVLLQHWRLDPLTWLGWQAEVFRSSRMRAYGTLGNPDFVAAWLCATVWLSVGLLATNTKKTVRYASAAAFALQLGAILATGSRVFLLALPAGAAVLAARRTGGRKWLWAGLPVAAALVWFSPARPLGTTIQGRLYLAQVTSSHWRQIPLVGYGPGGFQLQFAEWQVEWLRQHGPGRADRRFAGDLDHAHNDYLELWVDYGPVGLCAFLGLCGWLIGKAWRLRPKIAPAFGGAAWACAASLLAIACVDFPFHRPAEWGLYWIVLGALAGGLSVQPPAAEAVQCASSGSRSQ